MADKVQLGDFEVERAVLLGRGGELPSIWQGQPLTVEEPVAHAADGPFPIIGWRVVAGDDDSTSAEMPSPVLAAPAQDDSHWWLVRLEERDGAWLATAHPWPVRMRPSREARGTGLALSWADGPASATAGSLNDVEVSLSRTDSPFLAWDEEDDANVVGWLVDALTGERLPYEPWQAFGFGQPIARATEGSVRLPVRWITSDIDRLPPGRYGIAANLVSLQVHTDTAYIELLAEEPSAERRGIIMTAPRDARLRRFTVEPER